MKTLIPNIKTSYKKDNLTFICVLFSFLCVITSAILIMQSKLSLQEFMLYIIGVFLGNILVQIKLLRTDIKNLNK